MSINRRRTEAETTIATEATQIRNLHRRVRQLERHNLIGGLFQNFNVLLSNLNFSTNFQQLAEVLTFTSELDLKFLPERTYLNLDFRTENLLNMDQFPEMYTEFEASHFVSQLGDLSSNLGTPDLDALLKYQAKVADHIFEEEKKKIEARLLKNLHERNRN